MGTETIAGVGLTCPASTVLLVMAGSTWPCLSDARRPVLVPRTATEPPHPTLGPGATWPTALALPTYTRSTARHQPEHRSHCSRQLRDAHHRPPTCQRLQPRHNR